ncbi:MAG: type II secretion system F family protein [Lentisphaeria bacterium]|nr:type II secretion system F family protein [Lentisphaeria bacterium]
MLTSLLIPTTNSGGFLRPQLYYVSLVLSRLGLCVRHGLPLLPAVKSLSSLPEIRDSLRPNAAIWQRRTREMAKDMEAGLRLSEAMAARMGRAVPPYVLDAVREAEKTDTLAQALPEIAVGLERARAGSLNLSVLLMPLLTLTCCLTVVNGLQTFIMPKFVVMYQSMGVGAASQSGFSPVRVLALLQPLLLLGQCLVFLLPLVFALHAIFWRERWFYGMVETLARPLPFVGTVLRRLAAMEACTAVSCYLAAGLDLPEACQSAAYWIRSPWARKRLSHMADDVQDGIPWPDTWESQRLGTPLHDWMIRNAAAREKPAEGLDRVTEWCGLEARSLARQFLGAAEPTILIANAVLVGLVVLCIFRPLILLTMRMATDS